MIRTHDPPDHASDVQCLADLVRHHARHTPEAVAILAPDRPPLTYRALWAQVERVLRTLTALGIGPRDRVGIALPYGPEMAAAFLAVSSGAGSAPLNPNAGGAESRAALANVGVRALILGPGTAPPVRDAAEALGVPVLELSPTPGGAAGAFVLAGADPPDAGALAIGATEDVGLLLPTSGTTSRPRVVPLTHRNMLAGARNIAASLELAPADRCLNLALLFHGAGLMASVLSSVFVGAAVICCPGFDAGRFFDWLEGLHPTWYAAVPAVHRAVAAAAAETPERAAGTSLRLIRSGSAPLPAGVRTDLERRFGVPVVESYALSEAIQLACTPLGRDGRKPGSVGRPAGIAVAIMDESGTRLGPGEVGEIVCRGPSVMRGYHGDPVATERAFVDGWLRTGDQGFLDADGDLFLTGRLKEIINRGGAKVSPQEVDEAVLAHPDVLQATTFALPDEALGESVAVAVVPRPGTSITPGDIRAFAATRLPPVKTPSRILVVPAIPVGPTGKVQRLTLAAQLGLAAPAPARGLARRPRVPPRDLLEARLARMWEDLFDVPIGIDDDFFDLGGHSLRAALLMERIERASGRRLPPSVLLEAPTIARLAQAIRADAGRRPFLEIRGGDRPPFVFLHGDLNGAGFYCVKLAESLEPGQPFHAISSRGIGGEPVPPSIEAIAASHLETVRAARPGGPYLLGGFSHGGLVAFEMARQLEAAGETVALLFVVDIAADHRLHRRLPGPIARTVTAWRGRLARLRRDVAGLGVHDRVAVVLAAARRFLAGPPEMTIRARRLYETYRQLGRRYVPGPYRGRLTLVVATEDRTSGDPTLGWGRVAAQVSCLSIPGSHLDCVTRHVGLLGAHLRRALQRVAP